MPLRKTLFAPGEHYHICIRGNNKQDIFRNRADRLRLLFLILYLQSPENVPNIQRHLSKVQSAGSLGVGEELLSQVITGRYVSLEAFAFMTNHIHLAIAEVEEGGVVRYMQRVLNAYAKYFNTKYETVGHLFQGPYRAVHIESNEQLLYLSTYIHRNPRELPGVAGREHEYEWSSYQDYLGENRFSGLLDTSLVRGQFETSLEYKIFVDTSPAKEERYLFDTF
jgi:putative transposase